MYILVVFVCFLSFYILFAYFISHIYPMFHFMPIVWNLSTIGWKLLGVYAYVFHHMQLNVYFEICLHNMNYQI